MTSPLRLVHDRTGEGPPVVMLHGLGGTSNTFQAMMATLSGLAVCRPDLPGSGRSPVPEGTLDLEVLLASLAGFLDDLGLQRVALVGHSLGTLLCQHFAARAPERVSAMVLFGALTEPPGPARDGLRARAAAARTQGMAGIADDIIARTLAPYTLEREPLAAAFVRESLMRQSPEDYAKTCEALAAMPRANLTQIRVPVLLVTGNSDPVAPPSMAQEMVDGLADARLELLERCGHWTPVEQPVVCGRLAGEFLRRNAG